MSRSSAWLAAKFEVEVLYSTQPSRKSTHRAPAGRLATTSAYMRRLVAARIAQLLLDSRTSVLLVDARTGAPCPASRPPDPNVVALAALTNGLVDHFQEVIKRHPNLADAQLQRAAARIADLLLARIDLDGDGSGVDGVPRAPGHRHGPTNVQLVRPGAGKSARREQEDPEHMN